MKFMINEFDRDYRSWTGWFEKEFESLEAARAWCDAESWTGHDYYVEEPKKSVD